MKLSISLSTLLIAGFVVASSEPASAVVYCQYVSVPLCAVIVRPGVVLRPRPVARAVVDSRCRRRRSWRAGRNTDELRLSG